MARKKKQEVSEETLDEVDNYLSNDLDAYQQSMVFIELSKRRNSFDLLTAQRMLATIQFERLLNTIELESLDAKWTASVNAKIQSLDKTLNDLVRLEIEKTSKKIVIGDVRIETGESHSQKIKKDYIEKWGEKTAAVLNNPDSKRRVLNILESLRAGASGPIGAILDAEAKKEKEE